MTIMFWVLGAAAVVELLLAYIRPLWRIRNILAVLAVAGAAFAAGGLLAWRPNVFSAVLFISVLYRVLNMVRITQNRMHQGYLQRSTRRTSAVLIVSQVLLLIAWAAWDYWQPHGPGVWTVLAAMQLAVAAVLLASTIRRKKHTAWPHTSLHISDNNLPTVTVAIPARNETEDLQICLQQLIASDYPKLEILVLDDCSQTRRTTEIIRGFAHDGVRFIQGEEPSETWLPKNQAYDRLVHEASGQFILFCGVDVRMGPESIRQLITVLAAKNKQMASIMPWRLAGSGNAFTQSLRYWWELVPPRRLFHRPPVLSTCWIISRKVLEDAGGFRAVARSITPEAFFARKATASDAYSFIRASLASGIASAKSPLEQRATALRTRYPQLHRRPENVCALALTELLFLVLPFGLAVAGWAFHIGLAAWLLAVAAAALLTLTYEILILTTRTGRWPLGLVGVPAAMLYDIGLLHYSMWQYEFSTIDWKGRNICIPAMHVIPHLPKLD